MKHTGSMTSDIDTYTKSRPKLKRAKAGKQVVLQTGAYKAYMRDVSAVSLLTHDETLKLFRLLQSSTDPRERERITERLVSANLRLVVKIAHLYKPYASGVPLDDLIQEGNVGLLEGIRRFDPDRGYRLSTYVSHWIKQGIRRQLGGTETTAGTRVVRLPAHILALLPKLRRKRVELFDKTGEEPTTEQLAEALGVTCDSVLATLDAAGLTLSIDQSADADDDRSMSSARLETFMSSSMHTATSDASTPDEVIFRKQLHDMIRQGLATLTPREERVIRLRFGIGEDPKSPAFVMTQDDMTQLNMRAAESARNSQ